VTFGKYIINIADIYVINIVICKVKAIYFMNLRSVDLNLLTVFDAVMAEGNITRAAEKIGMSQPAMSIAISRFKHIAKDELFERTGRGVRPTPRALELSGPVRRALDIISETLEPGAAFDVRRSDRAFNVVFSGFGEVVMLPTLMRQLEQLESRVRINTRNVFHSNVEKEMHYGNVDLHLWIVPIESNDITCTQIGVTNEVCLVRKDHPTVGDFISVEEFAALRHVVYHMPGEYGPSLNDRELWRMGLKREHGMSIHSYFDAPRVLSYTDMICTMPQILGRHFARAHNLKVVPSPLQIEFPVYMIWPKSLDNDQGHKWLRQTLIEIFTKEQQQAN
jgi:DNA-binding transcriptional LysR family regulator